ncbi:Uncharacterised protein [Vibrio cholerae]|uniref:Uncharacterized protein n=1 Tax=Vibrio cholerae TaxID=666 RepID=A0A655UY47_VIBCL|nr:Uncharacterised protein [Vibrio cholerae]
MLYDSNACIALEIWLMLSAIAWLVADSSFIDEKILSVCDAASSVPWVIRCNACMA